MRIGTNPTKQDPNTEYPYYHKIIVPVYIPEMSGYFEQGLDVLRICLTSLMETIHSKALICVVSNGCCQEVNNYLLELFNKKLIGELILNEKNVGKIDSIIPIARGSWEPLITISDADVLFKDGWISAIEKAFQTNKQLGYCSPCPIPYAWAIENNNTILRASIKFKLQIKSFLNPNEIMKFTESIGRDEKYIKHPYLLENQLSYKDKTPLLFGAGHFVGSYHSSIFMKCPHAPSEKKLRGNSMHTYLDNPIEKSGLNRLATMTIFCHHIGNTLDDFILSEFNLSRSKSPFINPDFNRQKDFINYIPYPIRYVFGRLLKRIIQKKLSA